MYSPMILAHAIVRVTRWYYHYNYLAFLDIAAPRVSSDVLRLVLDVAERLAALHPRELQQMAGIGVRVRFAQQVKGN
jgi:hypothetical protein